MKNLTLFLTLILLSGCNYHDYEVNNELPKLKRPIRVIGKKCNDFGCGVILIDSDGKMLTAGNMSTMGKILGESYNVGDTIK